MNPDIWGKHAWRFLHCISFTYPNEPTLIDKQRYKVFFDSLGYVLPCNKCKFNYRNELLNTDLDDALESREKLSLFVFNLHNSVNKRLGKRIMSYNEVRDMYDDIIKNNKINKVITNPKTENIYETYIEKNKMIIGGLGLSLFIYMLYKIKKTN